MCWILYPYCKGYNKNLEYGKAKVVLKGSSVELYNSDLRQTLKGPGAVVDQAWIRNLVLHQTQPCNLAGRLKSRLGYKDLISASKSIEVLISDSSTVEEVRWFPREV
jgi:hypothetical protein